jgi:hypothetical protein
MPGAAKLKGLFIEVSYKKIIHETLANALIKLLSLVVFTPKGADILSSYIENIKDDLKFVYVENGTYPSLVAVSRFMQ